MVAMSILFIGIDWEERRRLSEVTRIRRLESLPDIYKFTIVTPPVDLTVSQWP